jgi:hypothetical protein
VRINLPACRLPHREKPWFESGNPQPINVWPANE